VARTPLSDKKTYFPIHYSLPSFGRTAQNPFETGIPRADRSATRASECRREEQAAAGEVLNRFSIGLTLLSNRDILDCDDYDECRGFVPLRLRNTRQASSRIKHRAFPGYNGSNPAIGLLVGNDSGHAYFTHLAEGFLDRRWSQCYAADPADIGFTANDI
jgi:hypothetical protein